MQAGVWPGSPLALLFQHRSAWISKPERLHRKFGGTDAAWGTHGQVYQCLLLYILSHGSAVDDTKVHVNVGPLENVWLDYAPLPRDAKTGFRLARSFQLRGLCQLCKAQQCWYKPFSTLRSQVYWRSLIVFVLSTNAPVQHFILCLGYLSWKCCCFGVAYRTSYYLLQWLQDFKVVMRIFCSSIYHPEVFWSCVALYVCPLSVCVFPSVSLTYRSDILDSCRPDFKGVVKPGKNWKRPGQKIYCHWWSHRQKKVTILHSGVPEGDDAHPKIRVGNTVVSQQTSKVKKVSLLLLMYTPAGSSVIGNNK